MADDRSVLSERRGPGGPVTSSGAPADHGASPGTVPPTPKTPPETANPGSRDEWLIRREGDAAAEVDPTHDDKSGTLRGRKP